jgi:hypothetical protein
VVEDVGEDGGDASVDQILHQFRWIEAGNGEGRE